MFRDNIEEMKSIEEANVSGKRVIVRCDFDVPLHDGKIEDESRIENVLPTLRILLEKGASLVLVSHAGRPDKPDPSLSLKPVREILEKALNQKIDFQEKLQINPEARINFLENIRFWHEEEENNESFAKNLASLGQIYINESFATSHRSHASMVGIPKFLPSYAGINLLREVEELRKMLENPARPLVAIIGGAKLETKLPAIYNLAKTADKVLVGGKLMFEVKIAALPENVVVAHDDIETKDIGQNSINLFRELIDSASTIIWNGPMGVFEEDRYMKGTEEVAVSVIESKSYSVVGGGDTIAALNKLGLLDKISFVSMGGGAMLDFLAGKRLPGLEALEKSHNE